MKKLENISVDPNLDFIVEENNFSIKYGEIQYITSKLSEIISRNFADIDIISLCIQDQSLFIILFLSLIKAGKTVALLSPKSTILEINNQTNSIKCRCIFTDQSLITNSKFSKTFIAKISKIDRTISIFQENNKEYSIDFSAIPQLNFIPINLFFSDFSARTIIFSSGSSGKSKAILHSINAHIYSALGANENMPINAGESWGLCLPLHHAGGLSVIFKCLLRSAKIVIIRDAGRPYKSIKSQTINYISMTPTQLLRVISDIKINGELTSIKGILIGGAAAGKSLRTEATAYNLPICYSYGSTESASQLCATSLIEKSNTNSSGKILKYRKIIISDDGEILCAGSTMCLGYLDGDKLIDIRDKNGYFHSKDAGFIDHQGELFVFGRIDNMFISGGENIYPEEVESALLSLNYIDEAIVIGAPNEEYGAIGVAFVRLISGCDRTYSTIKSDLKSILNSYKIPKIIYKIPKDYEPLGIKSNRIWIENFYYSRISELEII
jgi:O-succinylbenzoic acid--CoA ligase